MTKQCQKVLLSKDTAHLVDSNWYLFFFQFSPDITSSVPHHKHYALEIAENCSPTVEHCRIKSTSVGMYVSCCKHMVQHMRFWYCKFGNICEVFIFAKLHIYAKFRENKTLAKW